MPAKPDEPTQHVEVSALAFDRAGRKLVAVTEDGLVRVYDARRGRLIRSHKLGNDRSATSVAFAGERVAVGCTNGDILVFDPNGELVRDVRHRIGGVDSVAATPTRVVAGGEDGSLTVWDVP